MAIASWLWQQNEVTCSASESCCPKCGLKKVDWFCKNLTSMKIAYSRTSKKFGEFLLYYQKVKWMNASILLSLSFIPLRIPQYLFC